MPRGARKPSGEGWGCIYFAGKEVEILGVEFIAFLKVCHTHAVVTKLMNRRRAFLESLELVDVAVLLLRLFVASELARISRVKQVPETITCNHTLPIDCTHKIRLHLRELGIQGLSQLLPIHQMHREPIYGVI